MNILMRKKKEKELEEFRNNNQRVDFIVLIKDYEKTGLNRNQITSMLVEIMGGVDDADPENPKGLPYEPSIKSVNLCGDIMSIHVSASGNRDEIHRLRKKFINLMDCCKSWR